MGGGRLRGALVSEEHHVLRRERGRKHADVHVGCRAACAEPLRIPLQRLHIFPASEAGIAA